MKKLFILSALLLLALLFYFGSDNGWFSGQKPDLKNFAVEDSSVVDKIFLADRNGRKILLEKKTGTWMMNEKYEANEGWMSQLMETIFRVHAKCPVPKSAFENVVKQIATTHVKVEIYSKGEKTKTYFVGNPTPDRLGTYMLMEGSSSPYICDIQGFEGILSPRYNPDFKTWRSRKIFSFVPENIKKISINYFESFDESFEITQDERNITIKQFLVKHPLINKIDTGMVKYFTSLFTKIYAEAWGTVLPNENVDSIYKSQPFCIMEIEDANKKTKLIIHKKPVDLRTKSQYDNQGRPSNFDTDRYYAFMNDSKEIMLIQDYVFAPLLKKYSDFLSRK